MSAKKIRYAIEAVFVYALFGFFAVMPLDMASNFGGWIGRTLGPRLGANRKALRNLERAMPELSGREKEDVLQDMWDNLGRVMAEYPHLAKFDKTRVEVVNPEYLLDARAAGRPVLAFSGHFANWEVLPVTAAKWGMPMQLIYRHANNPYVDRLLRRARTPMGDGLRRKGFESVKSAHGALRTGGAVAMLIDQKHNRGLPIPFFGRPAMTATAIADLALKYNALIVPCGLERIAANPKRADGSAGALPATTRLRQENLSAHFRVTIEKPMEFTQGSDVANILTRLNRILEGWVRKNPGQWLWLHRRWGD